MRTASLILFLTLLTAIPARSQEAVAVGLKGKVHTVSTEEFRSDDGVHREQTGSTVDVYDPNGYQLEFFRYQPDGSVWAHTIYIRNAWQRNWVEKKIID